VSQPETCMSEFVSGIIQLKVPIPNNPLGFTNVYLVGQGDERVLIDAGFDSVEGFNALREQLAGANVSPRQISQIVITHGHGDHVGLAGKERELSGAKVSIHRIEAMHLHPPAGRREDSARTTREWARASGIPENLSPQTAVRGQAMRHFAEPAKPDFLLEDAQHVTGDDVDLMVIWAPGHSPGLVCLHDATRRVLFSSDHVLPVTTPNIGLRPGSYSGGEANPLADYLLSIRAVKDLDVDLVLPAHEQAFEDLHARAEEIERHHLHRNGEILDTLRSGPKTAYQIARIITWMPQTGGTKFSALNHWAQRLAVSETISHVQALKTEGEVERLGEHGIVYYGLKAKA
jgi:glyoxylase-like metal-dependent hydrolase (beta-lactamase superfamily II)